MPSSFILKVTHENLWKILFWSRPSDYSDIDFIDRMHRLHHEVQANFQRPLLCMVRLCTRQHPTFRAGRIPGCAAVGWRLCSNNHKSSHVRHTEQRSSAYWIFVLGKGPVGRPGFFLYDAWCLLNLQPAIQLPRQLIVINNSSILLNNFKQLIFCTWIYKGILIISFNTLINKINDHCF